MLPIDRLQHKIISNDSLVKPRKFAIPNPYFLKHSVQSTLKRYKCLSKKLLFTFFGVEPIEKQFACPALRSLFEKSEIYTDNIAEFINWDDEGNASIKYQVIDNLLDNLDLTLDEFLTKDYTFYNLGGAMEYMLEIMTDEVDEAFDYEVVEQRVKDEASTVKNPFYNVLPRHLHLLYYF